MTRIAPKVPAQALAYELAYELAQALIGTEADEGALGPAPRRV